MADILATLSNNNLWEDKIAHKSTTKMSVITVFNLLASAHQWLKLWVAVFLLEHHVEQCFLYQKCKYLTIQVTDTVFVFTIGI